MRIQIASGALAAIALAGCGQSGSDSPPVTPGPLEPPSNVHTAISAQGRCELLWTAAPAPVDGYEIMTSEPGWAFSDGDTHGGIAPGIATQADLDFSQTAARELTQVTMQIRTLRGSEASTFSPMVTCELPVISPNQVGSAIVNGGIEVFWDDFSAVATAVAIERATLDASGAPGSWSLLQTAPASQAMFNPSFLDSTPVAGAAYAYRVTAIAPTGERSASVVTTTLVLGAPLTTTTIALPASGFAVTDGKGHFAFTTFVTGGVQFTWGTQPASSSATLTVAMVFGLELDAAGLPHAVYSRSATTGTGQLIIHGWSNGAQWLEETVAQRQLEGTTNSPALDFALDASGTPVMMWALFNHHFEAANKMAGSWQIQSLDGVLSVFAGNYAVFSDATGAVHAIVDDAGLLHLELHGETWTSEPVPGGGGFEGPLLGAGTDPSHLVACYVDLAPWDFLLDEPYCVRKTSSGWTSPEPLGALPGRAETDEPIAAVALSADGQRVAVLFRGSAALLFRSDRPGAWSELAGAPGGPLNGFLGFDAAGKVFVLANTAGATASGGMVDYQLSSEP